MNRWKIVWTMTVAYSKYDIRKYSWIVNEHGETAFVWYYIGSGW